MYTPEALSYGPLHHRSTHQPTPTCTTWSYAHTCIEHPSTTAGVPSPSLALTATGKPKTTARAMARKKVRVLRIGICRPPP